MNKVLAQFPCQSRMGALRAWTVGFSLSSRLAEILKTLGTPGGDDLEILRAVKRHTVLRLGGLTPEHPTLIIKGFPLGRIKSRLQYRKYGVAEILNWQGARERGIPVPEYFGYFEWRPFGLVKANGVFMEDLRGHHSLDQLLQAEGAERMPVLRRAIPLLNQLYETGVNHVDPSPHNMMLPPDGRQLRMIDWEGCAFVPPRQISQLVLHAAHFLNFARIDSSQPEWRPWLDQLHAACVCPVPSSAVQKAVAALQPRGRVPLRERLALLLDENTRSMLQEP